MDTDKKITLWVDKQALKDETIKLFAEQHKICLIDLDDVFTKEFHKLFKKEYHFSLKKIIDMEKDKFPPNWAVLSDLYRYLILFCLAGTYLDVDINPKIFSLLTTLKEFIKKLEENKIILHENVNDLIALKTIRSDFLKELLSNVSFSYTLPLFYKEKMVKEIKLSLNGLNEFPVKYFRYWTTFLRTGPMCLYATTKHFQLVKPEDNFLFIKTITQQNLALSWVKDYINSEIINQVVKNLDPDDSIEDKLARNVIYELKERNVLYITHFDRFINKLTTQENSRKKVLGSIKNKLKEFLKVNKNFEIKSIVTKTKDEYEEFFKEIPVGNNAIIPDSFALKKAIKNQDKELISYFLSKKPSPLFEKINEKKALDYSILIKVYFHCYNNEQIKELFSKHIKEAALIIDKPTIISEYQEYLTHKDLNYLKKRYPTKYDNSKSMTENFKNFLKPL